MLDLGPFENKILTEKETFAHLLWGSRKQEAVHLRFKSVVNFNVDVVARRFLLIWVTHVLYVDHVVDDLCWNLD